MTKRMRTLATAVVVSVLAAPGARAMDSVVLKVDVPFDFVVVDRQLPSGEYRIVRAQDTSMVVVCLEEAGVEPNGGPELASRLRVSELDRDAQAVA